MKGHTKAENYILNTTSLVNYEGLVGLTIGHYVTFTFIFQQQERLAAQV